MRMVEHGCDTLANPPRGFGLFPARFAQGHAGYFGIDRVDRIADNWIRVRLRGRQPLILVLAVAPPRRGKRVVFAGSLFERGSRLLFSPPGRRGLVPALARRFSRVPGGR